MQRKIEFRLIPATASVRVRVVIGMLLTMCCSLPVNAQDGIDVARTTHDPNLYHATGAVPLHNEPFVAGDEMLIYFNAFSRNQQEPCPFGARSIGVAKLRRDGFVGLQSTDERHEGMVTTRLLPTNGDQLQLNVERRGDEGAVTVALLDDLGNELPGFTFADSMPITGNAIRIPARWKTHPDISSLRGQSIRAGLRLQGSAVIYALAFTESKE